MAPRKLDDTEISDALGRLPDGWTIEDGKLSRAWTFADFVTAFGFMTQVALVAEAMGHHPEWFNVYNRVNVALVTHDAGGLSESDFQLAARMEALATASPSAGVR